MTDPGEPREVREPCADAEPYVAIDIARAADETACVYGHRDADGVLHLDRLVLPGRVTTPTSGRNAVRSPLTARPESQTPGRRPAEETVPLILLDGPSAGRVLQVSPTCRQQAVPLPASHDFSLAYLGWHNPDAIGCWPTHTAYRVRRMVLVGAVAEGPLEYLAFHAGVSASGDEPDQAAVLRYAVPALGRLGLLTDAMREQLAGQIAVLPQHEPDRAIRAVHHGSRADRHDTRLSASRDYSRLQGACSCGWLTESAPSRRYDEVMALTGTHRLTANGREPGDTVAGVAGSPAQAPVDDRDWPAQGSTCAHVCGADPDHRCEAGATTMLTHALPSGGVRELPLCAPCHASERAMAADA